MRRSTVAVAGAALTLALSPALIPTAQAATHARPGGVQLTGKVIDLPASATAPDHSKKNRQHGPCGYPVSKPQIWAAPTSGLLRAGQHGTAEAQIFCNGRGVPNVNMSILLRYGSGWCTKSNSNGYSSCTTSRLYRTTNAVVTGRGEISNGFAFVVVKHKHH